MKALSFTLLESSQLKLALELGGYSLLAVKPFFCFPVLLPLVAHCVSYNFSLWVFTTPVHKCHSG